MFGEEQKVRKIRVKTRTFATDPLFGGTELVPPISAFTDPAAVVQKRQKIDCFSFYTSFLFPLSPRESGRPSGLAKRECFALFISVVCRFGLGHLADNNLGF